MKVDHEAHRPVAHPEIGQQLRFENIRYNRHRLQFNEDEVFNEKVDSMSDIDHYLSVHDWNRKFVPYLQPSVSQLVLEACFVDAFK